MEFAGRLLRLRFSGLAQTTRRGISASVDAHAGEHLEHKKSANMWRLLTFIGAFPAVIVAYINAERREAAEHEHYQRPEFIPYEHLRIRTKKFPWGDGNRSLFFNEKINPLPSGWVELEDDHGHGHH